MAHVCSYSLQLFALCIHSGGTEYVVELAKSSCDRIMEAAHPIFNVMPACNVSEYGCEPGVTVQLKIPSLRLGMLPVADNFWYCGGTEVLQTLPRLWHGLCAPVLLEEQLAVITLNYSHLASMLEPTHLHCPKRDLADTVVSSVFAPTLVSGAPIGKSICK